jgi:hypothetical protein
MRMNLRAIFFSFLAGLLVLTMQAATTAREADAAVAQIVICTDAGIVTVSVDADGQPVAAPHVCLDCLPSFHAAAVHVHVPMAGHLLAAREQPALNARTTAMPPKVGFQGRAPPGNRFGKP